MSDLEDYELMYNVVLESLQPHVSDVGVILSIPTTIADVVASAFVSYRNNHGSEFRPGTVVTFKSGAVKLIFIRSQGAQWYPCGRATDIRAIPGEPFSDGDIRQGIRQGIVEVVS